MKVLFKVIIVSFSLFVAPLIASEKIGVILMHGKWGKISNKAPIVKLDSFLRQKGITVVFKEMPWSRNRGLDKSYEDSMTEINELVQSLKDKGISKIVVGGHSMGANAAIGYGARYDGIAGILAIAPGHVPEVVGFQNKMDNDWQNAQKMVDEGKGDKIAQFKDLNQGKKSKKSIKANIYLSWYSPTGPAVIPNNVYKLKSETALFWIIGEKDLMNKRGKRYAYKYAPTNAKNAYVVVKGGHGVTPIKGKSEILKWLKSL